jgi:alkylhydroperoxidase family enzyme
MPSVSDRPAKARIEPVVDAGDDTQLTELLAKTILRDGAALNIFGTLAHHPRLLDRFNRFGGFLLNRGLVPPRERELVILRVGANAGSEYEFGQHTLMGRAAGLSDEEIAAVAAAPTTHPWSRTDLDLITMVDELCADDCVGEATFAALAERWDTDQLIELVVVAGFYRLVSGFLNSFGVELDPGVPGWPPGPRGPAST